MKNFKYYKRILFEKFNIYIYIIGPLIAMLIYFFIYKVFKFNLNTIATFKDKVIDISLALTGILLTLMGLFASFSTSNFFHELKKYNHDKIFYKTLFFGVISLLCTILICVSEKGIFLIPFLFLIGFTETIIAAKFIYDILMYLDN